MSKDELRPAVIQEDREFVAKMLEADGGWTTGYVANIRSGAYDTAEYVRIAASYRAEVARLTEQRVVEGIVSFVLEQRDNADRRLAECTNDKSALNFAAASVAMQRLANALTSGEWKH